MGNDQLLKLNRFPLFDILHEQLYEFPFGTTIVQFSIFLSMVIGILLQSTAWYNRIKYHQHLYKTHVYLIHFVNGYWHTAKVNCLVQSG